MPTSHHRPRNVPLTNNLTGNGDAGARKEGRFVAPLPFAKGSARMGGVIDYERERATRHHETAAQAARRALKRMIAAGLVKPVVVKPPVPSKWNPDRPRKKAPHWKARNVKLTGRVTGTGTSARIGYDEWERIKPKRKQAHAAFKLASRALKRMQTAARKAAA